MASVPVDLASEACRQTIQTEADFEVDHDVEAIQQITAYNVRLTACLDQRLQKEAQRARDLADVNEGHLKAMAEKKGRRFSIASAAEREAMPELNVPTKTLGDIARELRVCQVDPQRCCINSRAFRYEVVSLYILEKLSDHKEELVSGIRMLREMVFKFKGKPEHRKEYVDNVEMRLGHIETIYQSVFMATFDDENPLDDDVDFAARSERYFDNFQGNVKTLKEDAQAFSTREGAFNSRLEHLSNHLGTQRDQIEHQMGRVNKTCDQLGPVMDQLALALEHLGGVMDGISDCAVQTRSVDPGLQD